MLYWILFLAFVLQVLLLLFAALSPPAACGVALAAALASQVAVALGVAALLAGALAGTLARL